MSVILGISAFYHDSAAALLVNGKIVAAAQEERFTRKKQDAAYPRKAIDFVLEFSDISLNEVDAVVFYDKPFLKFERLLETYIAFAPKGFRSYLTSIPIWLKEKLFQKDMILKELRRHAGGFPDQEKLLFSEHHLSHAASAFYPSPYDEAVVLTMDGVGEWATCSVAIGRGKTLEIVKELHFPHSLGLLYSAMTYYLGFKVNSGEYKIMGLAPYGDPKYTELILSKLIDLKADGSFRLDMRYFNYATGFTMTNKKFSELFGHPVRESEDALDQFHMDMAASIQKVTEEIMLTITRSLATEHNIPNLCLAGGVALNCVANGEILKDGAFENIWIQPAAGDAGGSIGAAYAAWHIEFEQPRTTCPSDRMEGSYLGPEFTQTQIENALRSLGAVYDVIDSEDQINSITANALANGKAVGWFQGRMEFGPRSLGCRAILGDPRSAKMQKTLNLKVKYRESFRPFAPSVLQEDVADWFEIDVDSPYMLMVAGVSKRRRLEASPSAEKLFGIEKLNIQRSEIPAVTHVDYSARIHTVNSKTNEKYYNLLKAFKDLTDCPVLVNTSFNVRGEPIVCTPEDAFRCFMGTEIEMLVCGNTVLYKDKQNTSLAEDYKSKYELD